jgi:hypothetical protein
MTEPIERQLLAPARRAGEELAIVGVTSLPRGPLVQRSASGTWFIASDWPDDPSLKQDGAIAIPEAELERLHRLRNAGVRPDFLWIAHELPENWKPGQSLPTIVPDAPRYRELDNRMAAAIRPVLTATVGLAVVAGLGLAAGTLAAGTAIAAGAVAAGTAIATLDPVILIGVRHPREPLVAWALAAQWDW